MPTATISKHLYVPLSPGDKVTYFVPNLDRKAVRVLCRVERVDPLDARWVDLVVTSRSHPAYPKGKLLAGCLRAYTAPRK